MASFSGVTPFYDFKKGKAVRKILCKIYSIVLTILTTLVLYSVLHFMKYKTKNKLIIFLINCVMGISCLSSGTTTLSTAINIRKWERMLHLLRYAENVVLLQTGTQDRKHKPFCFLFFGLMSVSSLIYSIYDICFEVLDQNYPAILIFYLRFNMVIFLFLAIEITEIIYRKFEDLNDYIKLCLLKTTILQITNDTIVLMNISKIRRNYRILNDLVESYNKLFGMTILMFTLNVIFHILHSMNTFIFEWKNCSLDTNVTIRSFAPTLWCCVSVQHLTTKVAV